MNTWIKGVAREGNTTAVVAKANEEKKHRGGGISYQAMSGGYTQTFHFLSSRVSLQPVFGPNESLVIVAAVAGGRK